MKFLSFLTSVNQPNFFEKYRIVCFSGQKDFYPLLFFSLFFKQQKLNGLAVDTVQLEEDSASVMAKLSTSFLGNSSFYWLKNIAELKPKKSKSLLLFLEEYAGQNRIAFFMDETIAYTAQDVDLMVDIPSNIDEMTFFQLATVLGKPLPVYHKENVKKLFHKMRHTVSLDISCMLLRYLTVSGKNTTALLAGGLDHILAPEYSLNTLSKYFFSKDSRSFFKLWGYMADNYSPQFWIAFWSEQLWRAYNLIVLLRNRQFSEAKKISFRLPYAFVQGDWRKFDLKKLQDAHHFLYLIDCSLKNGGDNFALDLFYSQIFA